MLCLTNKASVFPILIFLVVIVNESTATNMTRTNPKKMSFILVYENNRYTRPINVSIIG
jgi:hypothetical protein